MDFKALAYFILIIILGVSSLFFFFNTFGKDRKNRMVSGKWSLVIGVVLLAITITAGVDFTRRVYNRMKTTVVSLQNFPQTIDTESSDTTDYVRSLKMYEPEKFKGKVPEQYYTYYGARDWWRFPLVYPYSIICIDKLDNGEITTDSGKTNFEKAGTVNMLSPSFDSLTFDAKYFAGKTVQEKNKPGSAERYFIFNFTNGMKESFSDLNALQKRLDEINFTGSRKFITIKEYNDRF